MTPRKSAVPAAASAHRQWASPDYARRNRRAKTPPDLLVGGAARAGEAIPDGQGVGSGERVETLPSAARMRSGVKGCANTLAPNGFSASLMAFMTAAGAPAVAAPPPPLGPGRESFCGVSAGPTPLSGLPSPPRRH